MCGERVRSPAGMIDGKARFGVKFVEEGSGAPERGASVDVAEGTFRLHATTSYGYRKDGR